MRIYAFEHSQLIAAPLEETFRFFEDPYNLARITPAWLNFEIVDLDPLPLRAGSRIEYRIRWLGIRRRWRTLIEEFDRPRRFVDVQVEGPYRQWRHEHRFEAAGERTLMRDRVEYALPYGIAGRVARWALVSRQLKGIFAYRAAKIREVFPGE